MGRRVLCLVAVGMLAVVGCGSRSSRRTYTTPVVTVTADRTGSDVTIRSGEGKVVVQGEESARTVARTVTRSGSEEKSAVKVSPIVAEKDLGIPLYPGASVMMSSPETSGKAWARAEVMLTTRDSDSSIVSANAGGSPEQARVPSVSRGGGDAGVTIPRPERDLTRSGGFSRLC